MIDVQLPSLNLLLVTLETFLGALGARFKSITMEMKNILARCLHQTIAQSLPSPKKLDTRKLMNMKLQIIFKFT